MFTRYTIRKQSGEIARHFHADVPPGFQMKLRFNGSVKSDFPVVKPAETGRTLTTMNWSLIRSGTELNSQIAMAPFFTYVAIAQRAATTRVFRSAFESRRCLVPADGFFLSKDMGPDVKERKPYFVRFKDDRLFAMAGIWETWRGIDTFAILITPSNDLLKTLHISMPVILSERDYDTWLDISKDPTPLYEPFQSDDLVYTEADPKIRNDENDYPEILEYTPIEN